ncbi:MAG: hypothetical protein OEY93_09975, partial [Anaerolineae bacterium]|nr:hypothetical protein [Anaerolineae bacterium]
VYTPEVVDPEKVAVAVAGAQELVGFQVHIPMMQPQGWEIADVEVREDRNFILFNYSGFAGRVLSFSQEDISDGHEPYSLGPAEFYEEVRVNGEDAVFIQGYPVGNSGEWDQDGSMRTLRWQEGDIVYTLMNAGGSPGHPGMLIFEDMVLMAESVQEQSGLQNTWPKPQTFTPVGYTSAAIEPKINDPDNLFVELQELAAFELKIPTILPENYSLDGFESISKEHVVLGYSCEVDKSWSFWYWQEVLEEQYINKTLSDLRLDVGASAVIESVPVWDTAGEYVRGTWRSAVIVSPGTPIPEEMVWDSTLNFHHLTWYVDGILYRITTSGGVLIPYEGPCSLDLQSLLTMVASMD